MKLKLKKEKIKKIKKKLDDSKKNHYNNYNICYKFRNITILLNYLFSGLISLAIIILTTFIFIKLFLRRMEKSGYSDDWHDLYGNQISNISYSINNIILNTFKKME